MSDFNLTEEVAGHHLEAYALMMELLADYRIEKILGRAEDLREQIVVPFCKKFDLTFVAGDGQWSFMTKPTETKQAQRWRVGQETCPTAADDNHWLITPEERLLKLLLDAGDKLEGVGAYIKAYPDHTGN